MIFPRSDLQEHVQQTSVCQRTLFFNLNSPKFPKVSFTWFMIDTSERLSNLKCVQCVSNHFVTRHNWTGFSSKITKKILSKARSCWKDLLNHNETEYLAALINATQILCSALKKNSFIFLWGREGESSASSIWNHKYDFGRKLHDTRFNYHFITAVLKSPKYRTWSIQISCWCSTEPVWD